MTAELLDGEKLSKKIEKKISREVSIFKQRTGFVPLLAVVLVGENPASMLYVKKKEEACKRVGMNFLKIDFSERISEGELLQEIEEINSDDKIHAAIIQLPLPNNINKSKVLNALSPEKDVDGFTAYNLGKTMQAKEKFLPATVKGIVTLLEENNLPLKKKHVVIVGHSLIVGRPLAEVFLNRNATVTVCHKATRNLEEHTKRADILVSAVGKADLISKEMVKEKAIVIDVGISKKDGKTVGDVSADVKKKASFITPVPRGVGPMTVASLLENTLFAAKKVCE